MTTTGSPRLTPSVVANSEMTGGLPRGDGQVALAALLAALLYGLWQWLGPEVVAAKTSLRIETVVPWHRIWVHENDGRELPVMTSVLFLALLAVGAAAWRGWRCPALAGRAVALAMALAFSALLLRTTVSTAFPIGGAGEYLETVGGWLTLAVAAMFLCRWTETRRLARWGLSLSLAAGAGLLIWFSQIGPAMDYNYLVAPALKLLEGEPLTGFYMQYSVGLTTLTALLMACRLEVHQMAWTVTALSMTWIGLYWLLARQLFVDRFTRLAFLLSVLAIRVLALHFHFSHFPQVSPLRLDLWVPLLLVLNRFGVWSPWPSVTAAAIYLADDFFGLLYLVLYWCAAVAVALSEGRWRTPRAALILSVPLVALSGHLAVFGGVWSPAGATYANVKLGFLPISARSMFWPLFAVALMLVPSQMRRASRADAILGWLTVALPAAQFVYFFGRSHEHNLLNVGGSSVLLLFLALQEMSRGHLAPRWPAALLFAVLAAAATPSGREHCRGAIAAFSDPDASFKQLSRFDAQADERFAGYRLDRDRTLIWSNVDGLINYRLGIRSHGFFSPLWASYDLEATAVAVTAALENGIHVIMSDPAADTSMAMVFNSARVLARRKLMWRVERSGSLGEIVLVPRPPRRAAVRRRAPRAARPRGRGAT